MRTLATWAALVVAVALGACTEKPQTADSGVKKPDAQVWQGADGAYAASGWKAGDQASWEQQIKARTQGQNEYVRIAQP